MHMTPITLSPDLLSATLLLTDFLNDLPKNPTMLSVHKHACDCAEAAAEYLEAPVFDGVFKLTVQRLEALAWAEIETAEQTQARDWWKAQGENYQGEYARYASV